jgi:hypothetical protein
MPEAGGGLRGPMKTLLVLLVCGVALSCSGPGGPAQRAGAAVDGAIYKVGEGISKVGNKIEGAAAGE